MVYIALKWLVSFSLAMWIALCWIDIYLKHNKKHTSREFIAKHYKVTHDYDNITEVTRRAQFQGNNWKYLNSYQQEGVVIFHYFIFVFGVIILSMFNKEKAVIKYIKDQIGKADICVKMVYIKAYTGSIFLKKSATRTGVAIKNYLKFFWECGQKIVTKLLTTVRRHDSATINQALLIKLKEIGQERKILGQLLFAAINENKNIRLQYQLETVEKNKLMRYIENTHHLLKENRSRYVNFQQLYFVTHLDNVFLKSRIKTITKEKEDAEKKLLELVSEIYKYKNSELKSYCSRLIVQTKHNLLNKDVSEEIRRFLHKSRGEVIPTSRKHLLELPDSQIPSTSTSVTFERTEDLNKLSQLVSTAPRLRGLPGECVWTIKDKNGIIEKLYECDYETDFDNGDIIRRIREYSVYYDKDCLLDHSNLVSRTSCPGLSASATRLRLSVYPLASPKFVTGSKEFRFFTQANKSVLPPRFQTPLLI